MQSHLTDADLQQHLLQLKKHVDAFKPGSAHLSAALESTSKHLSVYLKIIKTHIEQLARVLQLETHHQQCLENVLLAEPLLQLMQVFEKLEEDDIALMQRLAEAAPHFKIQETECSPVFAKTFSAA